MVVNVCMSNDCLIISVMFLIDIWSSRYLNLGLLLGMIRSIFKRDMPQSDRPLKENIGSKIIVFFWRCLSEVKNGVIFEQHEHNFVKDKHFHTFLISWVSW